MVRTKPNILETLSVYADPCDALPALDAYRNNVLTAAERNHVTVLNNQMTLALFNLTRTVDLLVLYGMFPYIGVTQLCKGEWGLDVRKFDQWAQMHMSVLRRKSEHCNFHNGRDMVGGIQAQGQLI